MASFTNPMSLQDHHIIITGAGQGIGEAIAVQCVGLGASVTLVGRRQEKLERVASSLPEDRVFIVPGDISLASFADRLVAKAEARFGRIHGLVNNAGISKPAMITNLTIETWQEVVDVNLSGSFYLLQAFGKQCIRGYEIDGRQSSIVNISSDAARRGTIGQIHYGAAKSGILGLTMCAAREWGRYGVRANTICFGFIETPMTEAVQDEKFREFYLRQIPLGRFSQPPEVAPSVCFLLSNAASYVTGQHISVNGGLHIGF